MKSMKITSLRSVQLISSVFLFMVTASVLIDAFLHPSALLKHIGIDSKIPLIGFVLYCSILKIIVKDIFPKKLTRINKIVIFPSLVATFLIFSGMEKYGYETLSLSIFGVHYEEFLFLVGLSGMLIYYGRILNKFNNLQIALYLCAPIFVITMSVVNITNISIFHSIVKEDGILETVQFIAFFLGGIVSILATTYVYNKNKIAFYIPLIIGFGLIVIALEEISWGQRIFGIQTPPELTKINYQNETTIHNIGIFQKYFFVVHILVGIWGALGRKLLPLFGLVSSKYHYLFAPKAYLMFYFLASSIYNFTAEFMLFYYEVGSAERTSISRWQEVSESLLAVGFFLFCIDIYILNKKYKQQ